MRPLGACPAATLAAIRFVLTDIDDTLTVAGRLPARAYDAMERLHDAGLLVVPITGRPAGWCDLIARQWPVDAVVGENGAFYFRYDDGRYDDSERRMIRRYWKSAAERQADRARLTRIEADILAAVPGARVAADQAYREADLAIDVSEDVAPLSDAEVARVVGLFRAAGATAKLSSIHVNGWFGAYDTLGMTRRLFAEVFATDLDAARAAVAFAGDSPNDAPLFAFFPNAVGVANVLDFAGRLDHEPAWVTAARGADGFVELARAILAARA
ncbi:MAG: HAD-IIB family hydrolase [Alphaproteobacteria bacterium]